MDKTSRVLDAERRTFAGSTWGMPTLCKEIAKDYQNFGFCKSNQQYVGSRLYCIDGELCEQNIDMIHPSESHC